MLNQIEQMHLSAHVHICVYVHNESEIEIETTLK